MRSLLLGLESFLPTILINVLPVEGGYWLRSPCYSFPLLSGLPSQFLRQGQHISVVIIFLLFAVLGSGLLCSIDVRAVAGWACLRKKAMVLHLDQRCTCRWPHSKLDHCHYLWVLEHVLLLGGRAIAWCRSSSISE
jgi:hypothetical protein